MPYLTSSIPTLKRGFGESILNLKNYHGEFLHAMVIGVTTMPNRSLSFKLFLLGVSPMTLMNRNVHGGAMWARLPITALVADVPVEEWATELPPYMAQPWDCMSHHHSVYKLESVSSSWIAKVDGDFTLLSTILLWIIQDNEVADDPAQHKQSHT